METLTRNSLQAYQWLGDTGNHLCENVRVVEFSANPILYIQEVDFVATR
ncbi:MAG: hypothetical protein RL140_129 [Actinomycetota bacterium]|jgi:hypothetical protein